jgi:hypothetical protein
MFSKYFNLFLSNVRATHAGPDLIDRMLGFGTDLEIQINVRTDIGRPIDGDAQKREHNGFEFGPIRIPYNASGKKGEPNWRDFPAKWPLCQYAAAIGSTGWCWRRRTSHWVGFDIDAIAGHKGSGISDGELEQVRQAAFALPYVEVRRSSSGTGYHLFVFLDSIPCANHTQHAILARRVVKKMSHDAGFDFSSRLDVCGQNFWFWRRNMNDQSFQLVKAAQ